MGAGHADIHRLAWAPQLLQVAADVADAMAYLHQPPAIVHRDLKSSNVLLDADGRAVVCGVCPSGAMCLFPIFRHMHDAEPGGCHPPKVAVVLQSILA